MVGVVVNSRIRVNKSSAFFCIHMPLICSYLNFLCFCNCWFLLMFIFFNIFQYFGSSSVYSSKGIGSRSSLNVHSQSGYSLSSLSTGSSPSLYIFPPHNREHNIFVSSSTTSSFFFEAGAAPLPFPTAAIPEIFQHYFAKGDNFCRQKLPPKYQLGKKLPSKYQSGRKLPPKYQSGCSIAPDKALVSTEKFWAQLFKTYDVFS